MKRAALALLVAAALVAAASAFMTYGPAGFRAEFRRAAAARLAAAAASPAPPVAEADLARLPAAVGRYLRICGAVGAPRVLDFHARFHGRIRRAPDAPWLAFTGEQYNVVAPPARLFFMRASERGIPFEALHVYADTAASMRVRIAGLIPVVHAGGPVMTAGETVTLFNDLCLFAPAALVDTSIRWEELGPRTVRATYAAGGHVVRAVLSFGEGGELADFVSDDRYQAAADGRSFTRLPWSTPVSGYRRFGGRRAARGGEARWHTPAGDYAYIQLELDTLEYNLPARRRR